MDSDPNAEVLKELDELRKVLTGEITPNGFVSTAVDWAEAFKLDFREDYLVANFWPVGKSLHIFAEPKAGKSMLALWIAANLAIGRDAFTSVAIEPQRVYYLDREMTLADVIDRLESMGFKADQLERLRYDLYPDIRPLDTREGGLDLLAKMNGEGCDHCVIDTLSRVVKGEENANDTYRNFHNWTGALLKAHGKSLLRLDHKGHNKTHSRGASSKADDVDLVYDLTRVNDGNAIQLKLTHQRVRGPWPVINLTISDDPVKFTMEGAHAYLNGARELARELDAVNAPLDVSRRKARELLMAAGVPGGKNAVLADAIRFRKDQLPWLGR